MVLARDDRGYGIFVCRDLFGWHDHRRGMRALVKEYRRSSRGCAYFIRAHRDCPFAKRRLRQLFILPLAAIVSAAAAAAAVVAGHGVAVAALLLGGIAVLQRTRSPARGTWRASLTRWLGWS